MFGLLNIILELSFILSLSKLRIFWGFIRVVICKGNYTAPEVGWVKRSKTKLNQQ